MRLSILIVEDHVVVRDGLRVLLTQDPDFRVVGEVSDGRTAVAAAIRLRPDVILMDIAMPRLNGLEATSQIIAAIPEAKILILSAHGEDSYVSHAMNAGASGFLLKQASAIELNKAIHEVIAGEFKMTPDADRPGIPRGIGNRLQAMTSKLTPREREVLQLIAEGNGNKLIAFMLGISIKTVEKHREHLMDKLDIHDIAGLTRYAIESGMIESALQVTIIESDENLKVH